MTAQPWSNMNNTSVNTWLKSFF